MQSLISGVLLCFAGGNDAGLISLSVASLPCRLRLSGGHQNGHQPQRGAALATRYIAPTNDTSTASTGELTHLSILILCSRLSGTESGS